MKRQLLIEVEVGDAKADECGACPHCHERCTYDPHTGKLGRDDVCEIDVWPEQALHDGKRLPECIEAERRAKGTS